MHIVMEVCQGGELFDSIVASGSFTERKAAAVFRKMVDVIHHCHELGVMHRCVLGMRTWCSYDAAVMFVCSFLTG